MSLANLFEKNRYKVMRRMALWEGRLSRGRLMDVLGLSGIRVSQLLREVREETTLQSQYSVVRPRGAS